MYRALPKAIPALDGLRGMAALVVLVSHSANAGWLPAMLGDGMGQAGVAIFYVLSGFLMAHVCFGKRFDADNLGAYLISRSSRVLPLFYLVVLVAGLASAFTGTVFYRTQDPGEFVAALFLLRGNGVLWSVAVECQFYLVFAALWLAKARGRLIPTVLLIGIPAFLFALHFGGKFERSVYLPFWLHFFLIGTAMRWLMDDGVRNRLPLRVPAAWAASIGWGTLAALVLLPPGVRIALGLPDYENYLDPVVIFITPFLIWGCCASSGPLALLGTQAVKRLGSISFGIYLLHSPFIVLFQQAGLDEVLPGFLCVLLLLALTILLAWLSHTAFEMPVRRFMVARPRQTRPGRYMPAAA